VGRFAGVAKKISRERKKLGRHEWLLRHFASRPYHVFGNGAQFWRCTYGWREQRRCDATVEIDRAAILAALESVSAVCIFAEKTATNFLERAQPDIYVKGGDYTLETLNQDERRAVEAAAGKIKIIPFVPGKSTTSLLEKISRL
jgi:hypothetical protein